MSHRPLLAASLSLLIMVCVGVGIYTRFHPRDVGLTVRFLDSHVAVLHPVPGLPLPPGIQDGDLADLRQQSPETRIDWNLPTRPLGESIGLVIQHPGEA